MSKTELSPEERRRWHKLYVAGWRVKRREASGRWVVADNHGIYRSAGHDARWSAVAEVVNWDA